MFRLRSNYPEVEGPPLENEDQMCQGERYYQRLLALDDREQKMSREKRLRIRRLIADFQDAPSAAFKRKPETREASIMRRRLEADAYDSRTFCKMLLES